MMATALKQLTALRNFTELHLREACGIFHFSWTIKDPLQQPPGNPNRRQTEIDISLQLVTLNCFEFLTYKKGNLLHVDILYLFNVLVEAPVVSEMMQFQCTLRVRMS